MYFWSGIQKMNVTFLHTTWPDFAQPLLRVVPQLRAAGFVVPVLECAIGIALVARRTRRVAVIAVIVLHIGILAMLIGSRENVAVWPWNAAMALVAALLFFNNAEPASNILVNRKFAGHALFAIAFGVMPLFSLAGWWDAYLSSALYSGNTAQAVVFLDPTMLARLPPQLLEYVWQASEPMFLDINRWSYGELGVPAYPAPRVLRHIGLEVCRDFRLRGARVRIVDPPDWRTGKSEFETIVCR
jgi:hypothetical protein